jgi:HD superfamily phosphohydrolase
MESTPTNKKKIFNDPVHGFISINTELIFDLIEHRYFQRLRRISQTGLTSYVYPGATHTRFQHAMGCMHLMYLALQVLKDKKIDITPPEEQAALIAILLHDVGHGPFSHALESTLMEGLHHEKVSLTLMQLLNEEFNGELTLAIEMFLGNYPRKFFNQLITSQLDVDRLDYLKRDSFYTGVSEGNINSERIISMMNVVNDELVIDAKGVYSIEKYLTARMFMYWQVYFHKTSVTAEILLIQALKRAKELVKENYKGLYLPDAVQYFLTKQNYTNLSKKDLHFFTKLDDTDLILTLKMGQKSTDKTFSLLSKSIIQRKLPYSTIKATPLAKEELLKITNDTRRVLQLEDVSYFVHQTTLNVLPYDSTQQPIKLLLKQADVIPLQNYENQIFNQALTFKKTRHHLCFPRNLY